MDGRMGNGFWGSAPCWPVWGEHMNPQQVTVAVGAVQNVRLYKQKERPTETAGGPL